MQNVIHYTEDPKPCAVSGISGGALIKQQENHGKSMLKPK